MNLLSHSAKAILLALTCQTAHAADPKVENLLLHMRNAYRAIKTAKFTTVSHFGETVFINSFTYKAPSKIRLDITAPGKTDFKASLIKVTDGKKIWMKFPNAVEFKESAFSVDNFAANLPVNLESLSFFDSCKQLSTAPGKNMAHSQLQILPSQPWNGKRWIVLHEHAPDQKLDCKYFVDPKSFLIWRTVVRQDGNPSVYEDSQITHLQLGPTVSDNVFGPQAHK